MPQIKSFPRDSQNVLGDLATFLYEDVLLYCESNDISGLSNDTSAQDYIQFIKKNKIRLKYKEKTKEIQNANVPNIKSTYLAPSVANQNIQDEIIFTTTPKAVFKSLFCHIRNAFAHNQIKIDGDYVLMYDRLPSSTNRPTNKRTMIGHIKKETLKNLIIRLKAIKKKK